jgi:hypothetical protein
MSAVLAGPTAGSRSQSTNDAIPLPAIRPIHERSSALSARNQGRSSFICASAVWVRSPMDLSSFPMASLCRWDMLTAYRSAAPVEAVSIVVSEQMLRRVVTPAPGRPVGTVEPRQDRAVDGIEALSEIAYWLERGRGETRRVEAYRKAAWALADLPEGEVERRMAE